MSDVLSASSEGVLEVTINRPGRLNTLDRAARGALLAALNGAVSDRDGRAVLLTGAGRAFRSGQDLSAADELLDAGATVRDSYNPLVATIRRSPKPVIAAINGPAVGAGLGWRWRATCAS